MFNVFWSHASGKQDFEKIKISINGMDRSPMSKFPYWNILRLFQSMFSFDSQCNFKLESNTHIEKIICDEYDTLVEKNKYTRENHIFNVIETAKNRAIPMYQILEHLIWI